MSELKFKVGDVVTANIKAITDEYSYDPDFLLYMLEYTTNKTYIVKRIEQDGDSEYIHLCENPLGSQVVIQDKSSNYNLAKNYIVSNILRDL